MNTFTEFCTWQVTPGKLVSDRTNKDYQFVMLRVSIPYIVKHGHSIAFVVRAQIPLPNNICAFKGFHRTTQETGIRKFPSLNFPGKQHPKPHSLSSNLATPSLPHSVSHISITSTWTHSTSNTHMCSRALSQHDTPKLGAVPTTKPFHYQVSPLGSHLGRASGQFFWWLYTQT